MLSTRSMSKAALNRAMPSTQHQRVCPSLWAKPPKPCQRQRVVAFAKVEKVNEEELEVILQDRAVPLVVDFFATWCGPCVMLSKELEQVAEELGDKVRVVKIDVDENPNLSSQLQIQGLPTMVFIGTNSDKPALRTEGYLPAETIKQILQDEL